MPTKDSGRSAGVVSLAVLERTIGVVRDGANFSDVDKPEAAKAILNRNPVAGEVMLTPFSHSIPDTVEAEIWLSAGAPFDNPGSTAPSFLHVPGSGGPPSSANPTPEVPSP